MERGKRQALSSFFGGTGFYIALLLCVCVAGGAGYWWLFGGSGEGEDALLVTDSAAVDKDGAHQSALEVALPEKDDGDTAAAVTPVVMPERQPRQTQSQSQPAESEGAEQEAVAAEPPTLIVSPLLGDTVTVFSAEMPLYNATTADWRTHDGIDIAAPAGTAVVAASGGTVKDVRADDRLGTVIVISHRDGYETTYASLQEELAVEVGDYVSAGQKIAAVGNTTLTESALGAHLHFSVTKDGAPMNPDEFLEG